MYDMQNLLAQYCMNVLGIGPVADMRMVRTSGTGKPYLYYRDKIEDANMHSTLALAYAATTLERNDVVFLLPESHSLAASVTWAKNNTHLVGMGGRPGVAFLCPTIAPGADFTPVMTQSGWWNTWANFRVEHGRGTATNYYGVTLSGHFNSWINMDLESPLNATEAADAGLISLYQSGGHNYFENCQIGNDNVVRSAANQLLNINTSGVASVFKGCRFTMFQNVATPYLIWCASGSGVQNRWTYFEDCVFIAYSSNWATPLTTAVGYNYSGGTGHRLIFRNCSFVGVTDVIASGYENNIQLIGGNTYISAATQSGMSIVPST